jgi:hypothetical protein
MADSGDALQGTAKLVEAELVDLDGPVGNVE